LHHTKTYKKILAISNRKAKRKSAMNKEIAKQAPDASTSEKKIVHTRHSTFEKIALVTAILGTLIGIGGFIALKLLANTVSPDMAALLICSLLSLVS
jgi:hypothetical protein